MTIILYKNLSDVNVARKELTEPFEIDGILRDGSSISDVSFTYDGDISIIKYNYLYIPNFDRYYFITSIGVVVNNLFTVNCHVDVLSTYLNAILPLYAIIGRQENSYNLYLDDDKFLVNAQRIMTVKEFPNKVPAPTATGASMILTVAGGAAGLPVTPSSSE